MRQSLALEAIRRAEADLRSMGVERALLFGSMARGDDDEYSDVDVALMVADGMVVPPRLHVSFYGALGDHIRDCLGDDTRFDVVALPCEKSEPEAAIMVEHVVAF